MVSYEADVLKYYNLYHLYNEWCHMKLTYYKKVNKIDFVPLTADCSDFSCSEVVRQIVQLFSGKLAMTTGHDMLVNLHLFE